MNRLLHEKGVGGSMFEGIVRLTGKTGYIVRGDSLLVIYFLSDHEIVMIDSGEFEDPEMIAYFDAQNIRIAAVINTHIHVDHVANSKRFIEHWGTEIYASERDLKTMRSPELIPIERGYHSQKYIQAVLRETDYEITPIPQGAIYVDIQNVRFHLVDLPGHTYGHLGIITPDGVCCLGDALLSKNMVEYSRMPYFANLELTLDSMKKIKTLDYPYFALAHYEIVTKDVVDSLVDLNLRHESEILDSVYTAIEKSEHIDIVGRKLMDIMRFHRVLQSPYAEAFEYTMKERIRYLAKLNRVEIKQNIVVKT